MREDLAAPAPGDSAEGDDRDFTALPEGSTEHPEAPRLHQSHLLLCHMRSARIDDKKISHGDRTSGASVEGERRAVTRQVDRGRHEVIDGGQASLRPEPVRYGNTLGSF